MKKQAILDNKIKTQRNKISPLIYCRAMTSTTANSDVQFAGAVAGPSRLSGVHDFPIHDSDMLNSTHPFPSPFHSIVLIPNTIIIRIYSSKPSFTLIFMLSPEVLQAIILHFHTALCSPWISQDHLQKKLGFLPENPP